MDWQRWIEQFQAWWNGLTPGAQDQVIGGLIVALVLAAGSIAWKVLGGAGTLIRNRLTRPTVPVPPPARLPTAPLAPGRTPAQPTPTTTPESEVGTLSRRLGSLLSSDDLRQIAADLGFDHENLRETKAGQALTLATWVVQGQRHADLDALLRRYYPHALNVAATGAPPAAGMLRPPDRRPVLGRAALKAELQRRIERGDDLIVLWGVGGVGKSALARYTFHDLAALFPAGRYWLDMRQDVATNLRSLLSELGTEAPASESSVPTLMAAVRRAVSGKRVLLVLDNAETLCAGDEARFPAEIEALRLHSPALTLVTTRTHYRTTDDLEVAHFTTEDALLLLRERLGWDEATAETERGDATQLIAYLDGHALALEVTTERMRDSQPPQRCAAALSDLKARGLPDRVLASFALSYEPLAAPAKAMFHALGVAAAGGVPLSALAVMTEQGEAAVEAALLSLSRHALATVDLNTRRARLHPLLHDYALRRAEADSAAYERLLLHHTEHFGVTIGGAYHRAIYGDGDQIEALTMIDAEQKNVRLAQERAVEQTFPDARLAVRLTDELRQYWGTARREKQVLTWWYPLIEKAEETGQKWEQANVLKAIGDTQAFRKETAAALASYQQAQAIYQQVSDRLGLANVLKAIGDVQTFRADQDAALASYQQAHTYYQQFGSLLGQANVLKAIGDVQAFHNEQGTALASYQQAQAIYQQVGDRLGLANVLKAIGDVRAFRNENDAALASYRQAHAFYQQVGSLLGRAYVLKAIGDVQAFCNENNAALTSYQQAQTFFQQVGSLLGQANVLKAIGDIQAFRDDHDSALTSYQQAQAFFLQVGDRLGQANVLTAIGQIRLVEGHQVEADRLLEEAVTIYRAIGDRWSVAAQTANYGLALCRHNQKDAARPYFARAAALFEEIGMADRVATYRALAEGNGDGDE